MLFRAYNNKVTAALNLYLTVDLVMVTCKFKQEKDGGGSGIGGDNNSSGHKNAVF